MQDNKMYHFLDKNQNDSFSNFSLSDKIEFFSLLNDYKIPYRDVLNLPKESKFGLELECEFANRKAIEKDLKPLLNWIVKDDCSLIETKGIEINSPILTDTKKTWRDLYKVCSTMKKNSIIYINSGFHIHNDASKYEYNLYYMKKLLKLWIAYENILFRFFYGEYLNERPSIDFYAAPIAKELVDSYICEKSTDRDLELTLRVLTIDRNKSLNLQNMRIRETDPKSDKVTSENRIGNGTKEPVIIQNSTNGFSRVTHYPTRNDYREDIIDNRIRINRKKGKMSNLKNYRLLDDDALFELVDLLFDNNEDKVNFSAQYYKRFGHTNKKEMVKAKCFFERL